jgi:carbonic anhydrase
MKPNRIIQSTVLIGLALLSAAALSQAQDRQSPVDFNAQNVDEVAKLPKIKVTMSNRVTLSVKNTWNPADTSVNGGPLPKEYCTVKVTVPDGAGSLWVDGRPYTLLQFHYHTPAEHTVAQGDGQPPAPMEVHFVFVDNQKQPGQPDSLLVIGAWMVEGKADKELAKIFSRLPAPNTAITVPDFNLARYFPAVKGTFRYPGGLTAPAFFAGFTPSLAEQIDTDIFPEIVLFVIADEPMILGSEQVDAFRALFPEPGGDARKTYPLAGRRVRHGK